MGIITFLLSNWRTFLYAAIAFGVAYGGFWLKATMVKAREGERLITINSMLQKRHDFDVKQAKIQAGENLLLSAQVKAFEDQTAADVKTVTKTIRIYVHDNRSCDVPIEVLKDLNRARGQP